MSQFHKVIKYMSLAFAIFLVVSIIQFSLVAIDYLAPMFGLEISSDNVDVEEIISLNNNDISYLDIDLLAANVEITQGEIFSAKTNNKNITCKKDNRKIKITEKKKSLFGKNSKSKLIITIPDNLMLDAVYIDAGAGQVTIDKLQAKTGSFDLGAGNFSISKINILNSLEIDSGAGKFTISDGSINNLDLDIGVGKVTICSSLSGRNEIDAGVGKLVLDLLDVKDGYSFDVEKGIGSITYNGENIKSSSFGQGKNIIDIEGGVGSIKITD